MEKIDTSGLSDLKPRTKFGDFEKIWSDIKNALDRKITLGEIHSNLVAGGLNVSYVTFTRWVRKQEEKELSGASRRPTSAPMQFTQVQEHIAEVVNQSDKSDSVVSTAGTALEIAKKQSNIDYSKLARTAKKNADPK